MFKTLVFNWLCVFMYGFQSFVNLNPNCIVKNNELFISSILIDFWASSFS